VKMLDELEDVKLAGELLMAVRTVAHQAGLKGQFRVALNNGRPAGQVVDHLHFHVLGEPKKSDFETESAAETQANGLI
jgi:diadenosine tetraphosphate (Ap4A) HIT family hydrolase